MWGSRNLVGGSGGGAATSRRAVVRLLTIATRPVTRGAVVRRLRLGCGLVLAAYLVTHFANHALGLVSLSAMEAGRVWFLRLWRNPVGTVALYGALLTHVALGLWSLYRRRHLRMPAWEACQLVLGLLIPGLLAGHVVGTRIAHAWFDATDSYVRVVLALWELRPERGAAQAATLVLAWLHACIGLHYWLRLRTWYGRVRGTLFAVALLLPVLALLGFAEAGREVSRRAREPGWITAVRRDTGPRDLTAGAALDRVQAEILAVFGAALASTLLARATRSWVESRRGRIRIAYPGGRVLSVSTGVTILEASRHGGVPHASICGGRGRCSTCRVLVTRGLDALPPASAAELRVLARVGAAPNVRLACQVRPTWDVAVTPLLPPTVGPRAGDATLEPHAGREQEVAVLFADLRGFTRIAERKLPYDVVFLLNRYFAAVGDAIARAGGVPNQFTGDGVMALFGLQTTPEAASREALVAAAEMVRNVADLSVALAGELPAPLRIGIGIHSGPAVVGRMGYEDTSYLTAVGDTVHVASRIEQLTKEYDCELVISEQVALRSGLDVSGYPRHELTVRNRAEPLAIRVVADARQAAAALAR